MNVRISIMMTEPWTAPHRPFLYEDRHLALSVFTEIPTPVKNQVPDKPVEIILKDPGILGKKK
jgi:hypothetical protein